MAGRRSAVEKSVFQGPLRLASVVASLVVVFSFAAFAIDEARSGSRSSRAGIAGTTFTAVTDPSGFADPSPAQERVREADHGAAREALDDADDVLLAPVAFVTQDNPSAWMRRSIPALLALAVYGFGLGFLSRFAAGRA